MEDNSKNYKYENLKLAALIIAALSTAFIVSAAIVRFDRITGTSMQPTLNENEWVLTSIFAYHSESPAYGDIIIFKKKSVTDMPIVKRVIGLSGDTVEIRDGILYRNKEAVKADSFYMEESEELPPTLVPEECYFVMGDNRLYSNDSRHWDDTFVKKEEIIGKVILKCFPKIQRLN